MTSIQIIGEYELLPDHLKNETDLQRIMDERRRIISNARSTGILKSLVLVLHETDPLWNSNLVRHIITHTMGLNISTIMICSSERKMHPEVRQSGDHRITQEGRYTYHG